MRLVFSCSYFGIEKCMLNLFYFFQSRENEIFPPYIFVLLSQTVPFQCVQCTKLLFCSFLFLYIIYFSIYSPLYLFSFSMLSCCWELSGCTAKPNSLSYNSSHALSYDCGCALSSIFSSWICGEDCNISEVSWSESLRFLPFSSFFPYYCFFLCVWTLTNSTYACIAGPKPLAATVKLADIFNMVWTGWIAVIFW